MKKRGLLMVAALVLSVILFAGLAGCTPELTEDEKAVVGKYEIIELKVDIYPYVTASTYSYFTIEFFSDRKCVVKSKAGSTEYEAEATWKINDDDEIEVVTKNGLATATEKYKIDGDIISGTNSDVVEGISLTMTVKFKRVVE